ncbi:MAG: ribbon-helix-helix protein, CopG family [Nitrospirae bacterium]|nr:ribbon-helix-helix protein, CopG family [Nitrospirota bacterium]
MKRITIFIDEEILYELEELAEEEQKTNSEIIREAITRFVREKRKKKGLSIACIAESGRKDIAEKHEQLL